MQSFGFVLGLGGCMDFDPATSKVKTAWPEDAAPPQPPMLLTPSIDLHAACIRQAGFLAKAKPYFRVSPVRELRRFKHKYRNFLKLIGTDPSVLYVRASPFVL
jgi:hypothetical protein